MMWPTRRQFCALVANRCPASCRPEATSQSRNCATMRPSAPRDDIADDEGVGADGAPIGKARRGIDVADLLKERAAVERLEETRVAEVGLDDVGDVGGELWIGAEEKRNGDRNRRDGALRLPTLQAAARRRCRHASHHRPRLPAAEVPVRTGASVPRDRLRLRGPCSCRRAAARRRVRRTRRWRTAPAGRAALAAIQISRSCSSSVRSRLASRRTLRPFEGCL